MVELDVVSGWVGARAPTVGTLILTVATKNHDVSRFSMDILPRGQEHGPLLTKKSFLGKCLI